MQYLRFLFSELFLYPQINERVGSNAAAVGQFLDLFGKFFVHGIVRDFGFHGNVYRHWFSFVPGFRQVMLIPEFAYFSVCACF